MDRISRNCNCSFNRASKKIKALNLKWCSLIISVYKKKVSLTAGFFCLERVNFVVYEIYCDVNGSSYVYWSPIN